MLWRQEPTGTNSASENKGKKFFAFILEFSKDIKLGDKEHFIIFIRYDWQ
jgi:hypothetical protein